MIKNNKKGFSLIELMVVVGIIGILAAVAVPNLLKFQAKAKQSNAKTELAALYGLEKAFAVEYAVYTGYMKLLGFAPDGVPTDKGCIGNNPAITDGASGASSTWPVRYYAVGFKASNPAPSQLSAASTACEATYVVSTVSKNASTTTSTTGTTSTTTATGAAAGAAAVCSTCFGKDDLGMSSVSASAFVIQATGKISTDQGNDADVWTINQNKILTNNTIGY